jgi:uncharacterized protein with von Willebrand factor type A (vWA) domain
MRGAVTRFAARDDGPAARLVGFMAHLRASGFKLGVAESDTALRALAAAPPEADAVRAALKCVACGSAEDWARFDALFDSYWRNGGRVRSKAVPAATPSHTRNGRSATEGQTGASGGKADAPDSGKDGDSEAGGDGRLVASTIRNLMKKDLWWFDRIPLEFMQDKDSDTLLAKYIGYMRYGYGWIDWKFIYGHKVA